MNDLKLKFIKRKDNKLFYNGIYKSKKIKMIVEEYYKGDTYFLEEGNLSDNEWSDVCSKYYYEDYIEVN